MQLLYSKSKLQRCKCDASLARRYQPKSRPHQFTCFVSPRQIQMVSFHLPFPLIATRCFESRRHRKEPTSVLMDWPQTPPLPTSWWIRNQNTGRFGPSVLQTTCSTFLTDTQLVTKKWNQPQSNVADKRFIHSPSKCLVCAFFHSDQWKCKLKMLKKKIKKKRRTDVRSLIHSDHWPCTLYWANLTSKSTQVNHNWQQCKSKPQFCHSSLS